MQGSPSGGDRRSRSRSRTPPRAGVELQLQLQNQALERAARLFRELRSEIEQLREQLAELREQLADLQRRQRSEFAWLARLTHRVAALEQQATGRAGPAPIASFATVRLDRQLHQPPSPPASPQEDWRGPDR